MLSFNLLWSTHTLVVLRSASSSREEVYKVLAEDVRSLAVTAEQARARLNVPMLKIPNVLDSFAKPAEYGVCPLPDNGKKVKLGVFDLPSMPSQISFFPKGTSRKSNGAGSYVSC